MPPWPLLFARRVPATLVRVGALAEAPPSVSDCVDLLQARLDALDADALRFFAPRFAHAAAVHTPATKATYDADLAITTDWQAFKASVASWRKVWLASPGTGDDLDGGGGQCERFGHDLDGWVLRFRNYGVPTTVHLSTEPGGIGGGGPVNTTDQGGGGLGGWWLLILGGLGYAFWKVTH